MRSAFRAAARFKIAGKISPRKTSKTSPSRKNLVTLISRSRPSIATSCGDCSRNSKYSSGLASCAMPMRRWTRRIGIAQLANPEEYLEFLEQSPQEVAMLGRDLLINVTRFFRDGEVFDVLRGEILPAILKRAAARKALRIWVPGCATGEEAYSIAMLVQEFVTARGEKWDVKIFATDVDKVSIEYAGRGLYPKSIAADVGPELLARFFVQESALRICPEIRKQVVFARHNILRDP